MEEEVVYEYLSGVEHDTELEDVYSSVEELLEERPFSSEEEIDLRGMKPGDYLQFYTGGDSNGIPAIHAVYCRPR